MIVMVRLIKAYSLRRLCGCSGTHKQVVLTTNITVKIDFILPELNVKTIMAWNFHVEDSAKVRYDMILGLYIITTLG